MLSSWDAHLGRGVSCLIFSQDGSHLISGGKDSMIHVWSMPEIVEEKGAALLAAFGLCESSFAELGQAVEQEARATHPNEPDELDDPALWA